MLPPRDVLPVSQLLGQPMTLARRQLLRLAAGSAAAGALARFASALDYPTRPVHLIVGFPPGGAADITARLIAQWLSERLGQQFIVENRPGAGTNIGTEAVVRAAGDGYTLLLVSVANTVNATLYERLNFNFVRDIAPVAGLIRGPLAMDLNPSVAAATVPEFIAWTSIHRSRPPRFPNSSPMPRPTRARSTSHRPATARPATWRSRCSR
jgi:tripartite-type tricarboxylate transporter receptor subunit TctC